MFRVFKLPLLLLTATVFLILCNLVVANFAYSQSWENVLDDALKGIKMRPEDLHFRTDYTDSDSFRLTIVDQLMEHPMESIDYSKLLAKKLLQTDNPLSTNLFNVAQEMDIKTSPPLMHLPGSPERIELQKILRTLKMAIVRSAGMV